MSLEPLAALPASPPPGRLDPLRRRLETQVAAAAERWRPVVARLTVAVGLRVALLRVRLAALTPRLAAAPGRLAAACQALWARPVVRWTLAPVLVLTGSALFGVHHLYADRQDVPALEPFIRFQPATIGEVYDSRGQLLIELAREYRRVVEYPDIPPVVREAILAAEDKNFFEHSGIDYGALPRVVWKTVAGSATASWRASREAEGFAPAVVFPQGGSTLTQQLVRGYFLRHLTSQEDGGRLLGDGVLASLAARVLGVPATNKLTRKIEEIRLSLWLEEQMARRYGSKQRAKEEIFARYASFIYMGNGRYGVAAASEYYFGRPLSTYRVEDAGRAAILAGITKSPRDYAPGPGNMERVRRRRDDILSLMVRGGALPEPVGRQCAAEKIRLAVRSRIKTEAPAVVENVFDELKRSGRGDVGVEALIDGRIRVDTTVDNRIQRVVNEALEAGLKAYEHRHPSARGAIQGSVVVLANDGRILAEAGGRQVYRDRYTSYSDYNRVTDSRRQPGSVMKPLVYLAAFRQGLALDHTAFDEPVAVPMGTHQPPKWIQNYDGEFKGPIPVRQALAESRNAATIRIAREVGIDEVIALAQDLGIHTPLQPYITTALGASEVQLLELANAYRALASGIVTEPYVVQKVSDASGSVLLVGVRPARPVSVSNEALAEIQEGLRGVVRLPSGTAHALASREFGIPVMGKTGTSSDFRDALFVGSTYGPTGITVAVRLGFDDNREMGRRETGGLAALPVFRDIVGGVYGQGLLGSPPEFPEAMESRISAYLSEAAWRADHKAEVPAEEMLPALQVRLAAPAIVPRAAALVPTVQFSLPMPHRGRRNR